MRERIELHIVILFPGRIAAEKEACYGRAGMSGGAAGGQALSHLTGPIYHISSIKFIMEKKRFHFLAIVNIAINMH